MTGWTGMSRCGGSDKNMRAVSLWRCSSFSLSGAGRRRLYIPADYWPQCMRKIVMFFENIIQWRRIRWFMYEPTHTMQAKFGHLVWDALCSMENFSYRIGDLGRKCIMFSDLKAIFLIQNRKNRARVYYVSRRAHIFLIHNCLKGRLVYEPLAWATPSCAMCRKRILLF